MKKLTKLASVFGFASVIAVTTAHGQIFTTISVDEFGNGFHNGTVVPSGIQPDPFNNGAPGLAYTLPIPWTSPVPVADILLFEPGSTNQLPSDLLRFEQDSTGQGTILFFYSDASAADPADALADQFGLPNPYPGFPR